MMNDCRTGDTPLVLNADGNYSNGQCATGTVPAATRTRTSTGSSATASTAPCVNFKKTVGRQAEDVVKRTRSQNVYELSQDLLDKQIELLERKYGGHARANHAARVIQRAFRHYSMRRKFATITAMAKAERRLSRRIQSEVEMAAWSAVTGSSPASAACAELSADELSTQAEYVIRNHFDALQRELIEQEVSRMPLRRQRMSPQHQHSLPNPALQYQYHVQQQHYHPHPLQHGIMHPQPHYNHYEAQYGQSVHLVNAHYNGAAANFPHGHGTPPSAAAAGGPAAAQVTSHCASALYSSHSFSEQRRASGDSKHRNHHHHKRIPPEVPRRTSSVLSKSPYSGPLSKSLERYDSQAPRSTTPTTNGSACHVDGNLRSGCMEERRHCNLSEHSTSEDSLEGAGYSNTFWANDSTVSNSSHVHSSPVPFPPVHYDNRLLAMGRTADTQAPANVSVSAVAPQQQHPQHPQHPQQQQQQTNAVTASQAKVLESIRKRQYRVGLNLFNKKPERGVAYLTQKGFLENTPRAVAKFFISRKGVSKQMIGEYLGNLQNPFNMAALDYFVEELDLSSMEIDVALRKFQTYFRMPGEAQKIERLMEVFGHRYCMCNPQVVARLRNPDTVFILAFAVIMLNTDLHTPSIKADKRMKLEDFIKNLRGIDDGADIDRDMLVGIYERVKGAEFKPGADHVTQVLKVQQSIVGKKPNLVLPHRRLVCYCRLYEVADALRRERPGLHQREVFLFNDILVVTKIFSKKKNGVTYSFRQNFQLAGLTVTYFENTNYSFGIRLSQRVDNRTLIMFNARNDHDRSKFCEDLREAILEMDEMETLRIEGELDKQRSAARLSRAPTNVTPQAASSAVTAVSKSCTPTANGGSAARDKADNRDSGVADLDHSGGSATTLEETSTPTPARRPNARSITRDAVMRAPEMALKRSTLSNSLLDIHDPTERYQRRGSVGSLDSGMSISFQSSTTNSTVSRDSSPKNLQTATGPVLHHAAAVKVRTLQHQSSFLGNIFQKRERKNSRGSSDYVASALPAKQQTLINASAPHCTDV